ncbi:hypothetical protein JQC79_19415 [Ochrobactrum anthropi]|uniref:hypothetical protein n=1 Tax=Brucella anthropi TaxID=529 RepID=UPI00194DC63C|nr:hypothetical protein [Brucella anthropi]MBM6397924.1 hypothetical protein [Brucella anthropi]
MGIHVSRRSFLRAAPIAGVALTVPAVASAVAPEMTPDERIDAALAEIIAVYREKWPDCPIRISDCDNGDAGMLVIVTHCGDDPSGYLNHKRIGTARHTA